MDRGTYQLLERYMLSCMGDSAHDKHHVYRVLYTALEIAAREGPVDADVLIAACLLHDIGRREEFEDPSLCHAEVGAEKAAAFLLEHGFDRAFADKVAHAILCHRFRSGRVPQSLEAKILFDADKLDVCGAIGVARTLLYNGAMARPLYSLDGEGRVSDGTEDAAPSFFREYKHKLEKLYGSFYTETAAAMAAGRRGAAEAFYESLLEEVRGAYTQGERLLAGLLDREAEAPQP